MLVTYILTIYDIFCKYSYKISIYDYLKYRKKNNLLENNIFIIVKLFDFIVNGDEYVILL